MMHRIGEELGRVGPHACGRASMWTVKEGQAVAPAALVPAMSLADRHRQPGALGG